MFPSSRVFRDTLTPIENPEFPIDVKNIMKKSTTKSDNLTLTSVRKNKKLQDTRLNFSQRENDVSDHLESMAKPGEHLDCLALNLTGMSQELLTNMFNLREANDHVTDQMESGKKSTIKTDRLTLNISGVSQELLTSMFNLRETNDHVTDQMERKKNSMIKADRLTLNIPGMSQELLKNMFYLHEASDCMPGQAVNRKKPSLNKVRNIKFEDECISEHNNSDDETHQTNPEIKSNENVSLYFNDNCHEEISFSKNRDNNTEGDQSFDHFDYKFKEESEVGSVSEKLHHDEYYFEFSDSKNGKNTTENDKHFSKRMYLVNESVGGDDNNNCCFDEKSNITVSDNRFSAINFEEEEDRRKKTSVEETELDIVEASGLISQSSVTSFINEQRCTSALDITSKTSSPTIHILRSNEVSSAIDCHRNMTNRVTKSSSTISEHISLFDVEDDQLNKQETNEENISMSNDDNVYFSHGSENSKPDLKIHEGCFPTYSHELEKKMHDFVTNDYENKESDSDSQCRNADNNIARNNSPLHANIDWEHQVIQMRENTNNKTASHSFQPTTAIDTFVNIEKNCESRSLKSASSFTDFQDAGLASWGFDCTQKTIVDNGITFGINQRRVEQRYNAQKDISNHTFKKHKLSLSKAEQIKNRQVNNKKNNLFPERSVAELTQQVDRINSRDKRNPFKVFTGYTAHRKLQLHELWKRNKPLQMYTCNDNNMVEGKNTKNKRKSVHSMSRSLQHVTRDLPKSKKNTVGTHRFVRTLKSIDRLLNGPYSKKSQVFQSIIQSQNTNITKVSRNKERNVSSKKNCRFVSVMTDSQTEKMNSGNLVDNCAQDRLTGSQENSLNFEDDLCIINGDMNEKTNEILACVNDKSCTLVFESRSNNSPEIVNDVKMMSSQTEGHSQIEEQITSDDMTVYQTESPESESKGSKTVILVDDLTINVYETSIEEFIKTQSNCVNADINDTDTENKESDVARKKQKKTGLNDVNSANEEPVDEVGHDETINITDEQNMCIPASTTLLYGNENCSLSSLELNDKKEGMNVIDISQGLSGKVDDNYALFTSPKVSYAPFRNALKNHTDLPSGSSNVPVATIAILDETSLSENKTEFTSLSENKMEFTPLLENRQELIPSSENKHELIPSSKSKHELISPLENKQELIPSSENKQDLISSAENKQELIPSSENKQDLISLSENKQELIPSSENKQDLIPSSENKQELIPSTENKQDLIPSSENKQELILSSENKQELIPSSENKQELILSSKSKHELISPLENKQELIPSSENKQELISLSENKQELIPSSENKQELIPSSENKQELIPSSENKQELIPSSENKQEFTLKPTLILKDLQQTFTPHRFPTVTNLTSVPLNMAALWLKSENVESKTPENEVRKSVSENHGTIQVHFNAVPNKVSPLAEDILWHNLPRKSSHQSLDSVSRKSVDYSIRNAALVIHPNSGNGHKPARVREESFIHKAIPFLPLPLSVLCLVLNIVLPGSGTAVSGFLTLCCGEPRISKKHDKILTTMCVNCMVGLAQLCTVTFLLIGWLWSITWGVKMVLLSVQRRREINEQKAIQLQTFTTSAFETSQK